MFNLLRTLSKRFPPIQRIMRERDELRNKLNHIARFCEPGHFYSPIPSLDLVRKDEKRIFNRAWKEVPGIDLNVAGQLELLEQFQPFYAEQPFPHEAGTDTRYYFNNWAFSYADALFLYSMIRLNRPRRIIEIGSGYSSFVMLDTNERFFNDQIQLTFIEPHGERLRSRLKPRDFQVAEIIPHPVQDVDLGRFEALGAGDILFVDSSHVSKVGSDVNLIVFEILPRLRSGVLVHFHDVFYPFEYPQEWIEEGRSWNEDYLLRAFLQFNSAFQIVAWDQFLGTFFADRLEKTMPLCLKGIGGSLWLRRV